jgi:MarR family transcriptional regulator, 2-MHQ and catechol-resistance regulon repressor
MDTAKEATVARRNLDARTRLAMSAYGYLARVSEFLNLFLGRQLDNFGLTMGQFRTLAALRDGGPTTQAELGEKLCCFDSNISFLAKTLERRDLVVRESKGRGRKGVTVRLTSAGQKLIDKVLPPYVDLVRAKMAALSAREQETLKKLCRKLASGDPVKFLLEIKRSIIYDAGDEDEG